MKKQRRVNIPMFMAGVLFCLTLISMHLTSGLYAKYTAKSASEDGARVAKFSVIETWNLLTEEIPVRIVPGGKDEVAVTVTNDSEVAIRYYIDVNNPYENLPLEFSVQVENINTLHPAPFEGDMAPGEEVNYVVVIQWNGDNDIEYSGKVDLIEISVSATQID